MKILIIGHVCIDRNVSESAAFTGAGSPAMFMQRVFARIPSVTIDIVAPYGKDFLPYTKGVSLYPESPGDYPTMVYENSIAHGVRTQRCFHDSTALPVPLHKIVQEKIRSADIVLIAPLSPVFPVTYVRDIRSYMSSSSTLTLLPQGYFRAIGPNGDVSPRVFIEADMLLPYIDTMILSDADYPDVLSAVSGWSAQATIVVTQASKGASIFDHGKKIEVRTTPVPEQDIVSSIGAGDIFSIGFAYRFAQTKDPVVAAQFGNTLAGACLRYPSDAIQVDSRLFDSLK